MIQEIRPQSCRKYLGLPILGPFLGDFTNWSHKKGYALGTIQNQLRETRVIVLLALC